MLALPAPTHYLRTACAVLLTLLAAAGLLSLLFGAAGSATIDAPPPSTATSAVAAGPYVAHEVLVGARSGAELINEIERLTAVSVRPTVIPSGTPDEWIVKLAPGAHATVPQAAGLFAALPGVTYAVPNYVAREAGQFIPNDRGRSTVRGGWRKLQWNFASHAGVGAPAAWATLIKDHHPGALGVTVAVLDTGIAYRNWHNFRRSPDFAGTRFVDPCDLVTGVVRGGRCTNPYALDRQGHGTFVAGTIAEATNNKIGLTGLAYRANVMPVRVLDAQGDGNASSIAAGIRYAASHGAKVINLSIEFTPGTTAAEIPDIISAINFAYVRGVVVVAAAGNDAATGIAYPARDSEVISVGATTRDICLAYYSNVGKGLDLVAPGGGDDISGMTGNNCHPNRNLPSVYQMTFNNPRHPDRFSLPGGWWGTSMSTPEVSAAAAMVVASRIIGSNPAPLRVLHQLEYSARPLAIRDGIPNDDYGYGLLDIATAVSKVVSSPVITSPTTTTTTTSSVTPAVETPTATTGQPTPSG